MKIKNKAIATTLIGASLLTGMITGYANEKPINCIDLTQASINRDINININGQLLSFPDQKPLLSESRTIVPVRFITEHLGGKISWNDNTKTAIIELDGKKIELPVNKKYAKVNGKKAELDTSATIINNRTYVPLRFVSETFGYDVSWNNKTNMVELNKKGNNLDAGGSKYFDEKLELYKMAGIVNNIVNDTVRVEGEGMYEEIVFRINEDTKIVDLDGKKLSKNDIKAESKVIVYHDATMTRSLPPIGHAQKIVVDNVNIEYSKIKQISDLNMEYGKITQITDIKNGKMFLIGNMNDGINFNVDEKTIIVDENEQELNRDVLTKGTDVEVYYGNIMTMSLPPITNAEKIIIKSKRIYNELEKLPENYTFELALSKGDVIGHHGEGYNIEKLDKFIDQFRNKKLNIGGMIRITHYTVEGDAIINDLVFTDEGLKCIKDSTRDKFGATDNKQEYKVLDILKTNEKNMTYYDIKTGKDEKLSLIFLNNR
ncbi:MAG: stalk domain-containing protein [Tepidibacter sp.]|jgi:hypothetical protein|uniref:stalk domain-containing protein n=1 Tax=Tepidibacter sp. TaxID=2529387 RepID=UPI0025D1BBF1|nr:stalk domain-containing protein [Tepidibacter sp.]MCT4508083.1 stalk domain-containing protein [Tepidibacter sp.]